MGGRKLRVIIIYTSGLLKKKKKKKLGIASSTAHCGIHKETGSVNISMKTQIRSLTYWLKIFPPRESLFKYTRVRRVA
jgi:hypothetical protein